MELSAIKMWDHLRREYKELKKGQNQALRMSTFRGQRLEEDSAIFGVARNKAGKNKQ